MNKYKIVQNRDSGRYVLLVWAGFNGSETYGFWQEIYSSSYKGCVERAFRKCGKKLEAN